MEFRIQKNEFLRGMRLAQSIADRKSTMPILANVLLRTSGNGTLLVAATDLNVSLSAELASTNTAEGGLTLAAKALHDIVVNMPDEDVHLKRSDNNWAEIRAGKVEYRIVGMPDRDFPKIPDHREVAFAEVDAQRFREMIEKTLISVCNDETRFHLNGVLFESDGTSARMVSTDGHRLSKVEATLDDAPVLAAGVIIPKKGLVEIKRTLDGLAGTCSVAVKTPYLFLRAGDIALAVKLIEAQFPPYQQVIPTANERLARVSRALLMGALKRALLMSSESRGVKFSLEPGVIRIVGDNPDVGEVQEELEAEYDGEPITVGFNPKYVLELISQMATEKVSLELGSELDPGLIRPVDGEDYLGVVMPMRI